MHKYAAFFACTFMASVLWAWRALPQMNEQGDKFQMFQWLATQIAVPLLLLTLLRYHRKYIYLLVGGYAVYSLLHAVGLAGWGFMGLYTPLSVYGSAALLSVGGLGLLYQSLKDIGIGKKEKYYGIDD